MKQIVTKTILALTLISAANAGNKFNNLSEEYLIGKVSVDVRKVIAKDPQTSTKTLKILAQDVNEDVRKSAIKNLH